MKLRLITSRKEVNRASGREEVIVFAVVDLDKSKTYPANFICLLPKELKSRNNSTNVFVQVFGDEAPSVAKKLLTGALRVESDSDVKMELKRRLKCFEAPIVPEAECVVCGRKFIPRKYGRFTQRICSNCRR